MTDDVVYYEVDDASPSPEYYLDHYGSCSAQKCVCLVDKTWYGRACPSWVPCGFTTHAEHLEWFLGQKPPPPPVD